MRSVNVTKWKLIVVNSLYLVTTVGIMKEDEDFTKCDIDPVDLEFRDVRYSVPEGRKRGK